ncbi:MULTISPECIES: aldo/keto reductase [unclassified Paenibacillus]|uniref:aldo/keto reductase n=1 Tax=unclassified Paenibacillus TaxID=185978 RepID=UPI001AE76D99|nr:MULTISPECIES: aldo/keto reductase [unclassified Paenibacillus]MBP1155463.1 aryl-alcohol dehydrogenase-like predicted oxidoreductase [Paenibacillus sp. PvP091]MBP1169152.1 aryl-alcohol dehydrogenase-like predicted oxidoreductase [Paenibacillus sp. PvR098]MBP2440180.1 aryl-alcohol dehydrogenase-like predicted oxidoreductase [Paenibacillus sp. PvP052]
MEYRVLGKSGIAVSELCLGTMTFGNTTNEQDSIEMVHRFLERGGNFIDTADVYVSGTSEEIVGKAIREHRSDVILATKVRFPTGSNINHVGLSRKHILDGVEASLRRLGTDYIDLYQMHVWDQITPIEETLRTLDDLVTSGKVRYIGCSNFLAYQLMKSLSISDFSRYARFISIQPQYSLVCRTMDREVLPLCLEENVGVIPWAPLGGGFLTGRYVRGQEPTEGRLASKMGESRWEIRNTEKNFQILDEVISVAREVDKTPAQVALNWLIHKPGITSPIFGARTLEQFEENMGAMDWKLDAEQWQRLDDVSALESEYPTRFIDKFWRKV